RGTLALSNHNRLSASFGSSRARTTGRTIGAGAGDAAVALGAFVAAAAAAAIPMVSGTGPLPPLLPTAHGLSAPTAPDGAGHEDDSNGRLAGGGGAAA